jgi:hypothetical protein
LNHNIPKWPIKAHGVMPLQVRKEISQCNEMNDEIFEIGIDINMWGIARDVIEPILFHPQSHLMAHRRWGHMALVDWWRVLTNGCNYVPCACSYGRIQTFGRGWLSSVAGLSPTSLKRFTVSR